MLVSFLSLLSRALGWGYFTAWSLSFWPQTVVMYRRRASTGLSLDFLLLNVLGFACYSASTFALYYSPTVREQYAARHGELPSTHLNDVAFAVHGLALCLAQGVMAIVFPKAPTQGVALWAKLIFAALIAALAGTIGVVWRGLGEKGGLEWLDVVWLLSTEKLIITILKWLPQIALNYKRKSTRGFAISVIVLDVAGGLLSFAQLGVDAVIVGSWWAVAGDPGKIGLSLLTLAFDGIVLVQHYVFYGDAIVPSEGSFNYRGEEATAEAGEADPLLEEGRREA